MEDTMYFGSMLMAVGMSTVFIILALVVLGGKIMIFITNRFAPLPISITTQTVQATRASSSKIAAITAVVETITQGKGQITEIRKSKE